MQLRGGDAASRYFCALTLTLASMKFTNMTNTMMLRENKADRWALGWALGVPGGGPEHVKKKKDAAKAKWNSKTSL